MFRLVDALVSLVPPPREKQGVLLVRTFGIGDALVFRATLSLYAKVLGVPTETITVLGSTAWAPALPFFERVAVELIDERRFTRDLLYRLRVMLRLRRRGFRIALCGMRYRYPHVAESLLLASGADQRIVAEPQPSDKLDAMFAHYRPRMTRMVPLPEPRRRFAEDGTPLPRRHEIEQQLDFLSALGGREMTLSGLPELSVPPGGPPLVREGERYVVVNLGASHPPRRWPPARNLEIAGRLMAAGCSVVLLGGPAEAGMRAEVEAALPSLSPPSPGSGARAIVGISSLDFPAATRLVAGAAAVLCADTGIGHLAVMLRRPAVLVVGGGHFGPFMPYPAALTPPRVRFLHAPMPCFHCDWACGNLPASGGTFPCIERVGVEAVWTALTDVLKG